VFFDKDNISDRVLKKIGTYVVQSDFLPDIVGRVSLAAKSLCMWVRAMELYGRIYRVVEPKRQRLYAAEATLNEKQAQLQEAMDKLAEVRCFDPITERGANFCDLYICLSACLSVCIYS